MKKLLIMLILAIPLYVLSISNYSITISGIVRDMNGNGIVGASVLEKGTKNGTVTDANGNFQLNVKNGSAKLIVSAVGFSAKDVKVKEGEVMAITLENSKAELHEVVVMGYQLDGRAPGLVVGNANSQVRIRGSNSKYSPHGVGYDDGMNREGYAPIKENIFHKAGKEPLSTFSIDVDGASYSNVRRFLNNNNLPPAGSVRVEEMINYFKYEYAQPQGEHPFSIHTEVAACPWNPKHKLALIGLQGKVIETANLPASNLVFLIDVSGSMQSPDKLPLVKSSLKLLTEQLREQDKISIVVYAGSAGLVLPSTSGANKAEIVRAIDALEAGGSTAGGAGIRLAYNTAREAFISGGNNRVILCTDGDFNVGVSSDAEMEKLIEKERESGVFLTVLGYGTGNYQDSKMQVLANKGNGNHSYIDGISEARKVLVNEFGGTLFTIAKDVKLQVEFNPATVNGYRLIGYENRMLEHQDFNDDKKDAGELGSGHTVTALYEIIPVGVEMEGGSIDDLKYSKPSKATGSDDLFTVKFRYKAPGGGGSKLLSKVVLNNEASEMSQNLEFASAVAEFGLILSDSKFKANSNPASVLTRAQKAIGADREGYRKEFLDLVKKVQSLSLSKALQGKIPN